jgi:tetratricopeptide (TPR) repeat protein
MSIHMTDSPLSVVILAADPGDLLEITLQSLRPLAGQCLVVGLGNQSPPSGSKTSDRGLPAGIEWVEHPWTEDFAACRNAAMQQAGGTWLLWLEAGEVVPPATAKALQRMFDEGLDPQHGYELPLRGAIHGGGREQVYQLRLHPRREDLRFVGRVRERLKAGEGGKELSFQTLDLTIVRSAAMRQPGVLRERAARKVRLAQRALAEQGESADLHNGLAEAYLTLGQIGAAGRHFQQALPLAPSGSKEQLEAYYGLLTCLDAAGPDRHAQLSLVLHALETFPLDAQLLVALGGYLRSLDYLPTAVRAFDVAFREGQVERRLWHLLEIRELAAACGASTWMAMGQPASAVHLLEAAWRMLPTSRLLPQELAATYRRLGRVGEAQRLEAWLQDQAPDAESAAADEAPAAAPLVRVDPPGQTPLPARPPAAEAVERRFPSCPGV